MLKEEKVTLQARTLTGHLYLIAKFNTADVLTQEGVLE
jgi:hypothetical protein